MRGCAACLALCLPILGSSALGGAKSPAEDVVIKMLSELEKMADALSSMKNEETSAAGREELKKHVVVYRDLRQKAEKLPPPPREVKDRLAKEYKKKFVAIQERLNLEVTRVRAAVPGGREALIEISDLLRGRDEKTKAPKEKGDGKK